MLTVIVNGEVFAPEPLGRKTVVVAGGRIAHLGDIDVPALARSGLPHEVLDAAGCIVAPGIIDPHEHLIGGSGEQGFATQTPEIQLTELLQGGITTVVGCLGTDTATRTMPALLAKAKGLKDEGLTAYIWSGGYTVPPATLTGDPLRDMLLVDEVIGAGEVAVSDRRSSAPSMPELARIVRQCYVGGTLTGKAGVTHFHVGDETARLQPLRTLLEEYGIEPSWIYPTHITRTEELMREAIALSGQGVTVDIDTVDLDLPKWLPFYLSNGGDPARLTISSDAAINSPGSVLSQLQDCVRRGLVELSQALRFVTRNTASVLNLQKKGAIEAGRDADLILLARENLDLRDVIARGRVLFSNGKPAVRERYLAGSNRVIELHGSKR